MEVQLSKGAVAAIWEDPPAVSAAGKPLALQVMNLRPWPPAPDSGWKAMVLSDGDHIICGALSPDLAASPAAFSMRQGAVVSLPEFKFVVKVGKRLIIPKGLEVLQTEWVRIGNPKPYEPAHWVGKHEELNPQLASSSSKLKTGAYSAGQGLELLLTRGVVVMFQQPVMQVVSVITSRQGMLEKFHLALSDAVHTKNVILASQLNHLVKNSHLRMGTIVRLLEFTCNTIQSPSIVIVVQLEILQIKCELIGRPKACELCCTGKHYELQIQHGEPYHGSVPNYTQPDNAYYSGAQGWKGLLTEGTVVAMLEGKMTDEQQPVMQVVNVSLASIKDNNFSVYHVLLSDGVYQEHAVLSDETHSLVQQNRLRDGSIVRILVFRCKSSMNYRDFGVCLEVLQTECGLIGSPRFHEFGLKRKEPSVNSDANVPMLPEQNYPAADSVVDRCVKEVSMNLPEVNWLNCIPRWLQEAAAKESNWHP